MQHHLVNYTEIYLDKKAYGNGIQYFFKRPYRALQGLGQWFETFINCLQNFRKLITFTRKINEQLMLWPM